MSPVLRPPATPFLGGVSGSEASAVIFAAPHGTPYPGIDNRVHAGTADAVRAATAADTLWRDHWDFDLNGPVFPDLSFRLHDAGDLPTMPDDGPGNRAMIEAATRDILDRGAIPLMLGGDDSVPIPFLAGFAGHGPVTVLQVDAHIDWREERYGERLGFSSTMRRASEMTHVEHILQVGIRGLGSARAAEVKDARDWGARIVTARQVAAEGITAALDQVEPGARVIVCLDLDALDGAVMPAVMYPSPGGLTFNDITALLAGVAGRSMLAGFSMVEFVPGRDRDGLAAFVAGRILWHAVGQLARTRRSR